MFFRVNVSDTFKETFGDRMGKYQYPVDPMVKVVIASRCTLIELMDNSDVFSPIYIQIPSVGGQKQPSTVYFDTIC